MIHSRKQWKLGAIMLGSCMLLGISTASIAETQLTVENDGMALTAIASSSKDILSTSIRVVGPNGFVFEDRYEDSTLQWIPEGNLADGRYNWEVRTVTVTPGAPMREIDAPQASASDPTGHERAGVSSTTAANTEQPAIEIPIERYFEEADKRVHTESGSFEVRDGWMIPSVEESPPLSQNRDYNLFERAITAVLDFVIPSAHAQNFTDDVVITKGGPAVILNSTLSSGENWKIEGNTAAWFFRDQQNVTIPFEIRPGAGNNNALTIESNGNIGLGTSTPTNALHITDAAPIIRFEDTNDAQDWALLAGGGGYRVEDLTTGTVPFRIDTGAPTDSINIASNGNVGIGTNSPTVDLQVLGTIAPGFGGPTFPTYRFGVGNEVTGFSSPTSNTISMITSGAERVRITSTGDVGIGTSAPSVAINAVRSSGGPDLSMFRLENDGGNRFEFVNTRPGVGGEWQFINSSNPDGADLVIRELTKNAQEEFRLEQNGNLTISGSLTANGSTFPDYVFEPDYDLMPLGELKSFIDLNGHLPGIPSAEEAEQNGIDMTKLQKKILEKVEELTLYTMAQEAEITHLTAQLKELQEEKQL